jgi:hypothetical protein
MGAGSSVITSYCKVEETLAPLFLLIIFRGEASDQDDEEFGSFASSGPKLFDTSKQSNAMFASLQKRIADKLKTLSPTIKPCSLVIHPVHDLDVDLERVIAEFLQHPDVSSHFSEVWFASERRVAQLI